MDLLAGLWASCWPYVWVVVSLACIIGCGYADRMRGSPTEIIDRVAKEYYEKKLNRNIDIDDIDLGWGKASDVVIYATLLLIIIIPAIHGSDNPQLYALGFMLTFFMGIAPRWGEGMFAVLQNKVYDPLIRPFKFKPYQKLIEKTKSPPVSNLLRGTFFLPCAVLLGFATQSPLFALICGVTLVTSIHVPAAIVGAMTSEQVKKLYKKDVIENIQQTMEVIRGCYVGAGFFIAALVVM